MKLNSKLIYASAGSLLTLLLVFIFNLLFLSNSLVPVSTVEPHVEANCNIDSPSEIEHKGVPTQNQSVAAPSTNIEKTKSIVKKQPTKPSCGESCIDSLLSNLLSGKKTNDDGINISSSQAKLIASRLSSNPEQLLTLESTLSGLSDQNSRDTILYVLSKLPDEQTQLSARKLAVSENIRDRMDGLSLLQSSIGSNIDVANELKQIISSENNSDVLLSAIKISHSLNPDQVDSITQNRLTNLINDSAGNDSVRSAALIAKTRIIKDDNSLQRDVNTALNSKSKRFSEAGLQALDHVLERQKRTKNNTNWKETTTVRKDVERIANNPNADPSTRVEALNLIKRHFHNR